MTFLTDLDEVLRTRGVKVQTHAGWKTRGYNGLSFAAVRGTLWHHTASPSARYSNGAPTLDICMYGRPGLAGPLCQIVLGRDGTAHVIAAGWGNHAGTGSYPGIPRDQGNQYLIGVEMESSGLPPYDWTPAQLEAIPVLRDALRDGYGHKLDIGHMEWSDGGKIDPAGLPGGMNWLRTAKANSTVKAASATKIEDIMATLDKEDYERIAKAVWGYKNPDPKISGNRDAYSHLRVASNGVGQVLSHIGGLLKKLPGAVWGYKNLSLTNDDAYQQLADIQEAVAPAPAAPEPEEAK